MMQVCLLWLCALVIAVSAEKDYYDILDLGQDADARAIKKAFRKLSLKYHPDKNPGDETAAAKFVEVNEAYEVLSDEDKRQVYDMDGLAGLEQMKNGGQRRGGSPFDMFFGGGGGGGGGRRKGPDYRMEYKVTLEELYNGAEKTMSIARNVICRDCKGTGAKDGKTKKCKYCAGKGTTTKLQKLGPGFNVQMQVQCERCGGRGKSAAAKCNKCGGKKVLNQDKELDIVIEKGMPNGYEMVFQRASEQSPDTTPGDVILILKTAKHRLFQRDGNNLHMDMQISLKDSLLGFQRRFTHLDGRKVTVSRTGKITPPDFVEELKGEGMPQHEFSSEKGSLFIKFKIKFPKTLTNKQSDVLKGIF